MEKNKKELGAEFKYTPEKKNKAQVKSKEELDSALVYNPKKSENATQKKQTTASKSTKKTEKKNNKKTAAANPFTYSKKTDKKNDKKKNELSVYSKLTKRKNKKNISDDEVLLLGQGPLSDRAAERVSQGVLQKRDEKRQLKKTRAENKKLLESGTKREEELYRAAEAVWKWRQSFGAEYGIKYAEGKKYKDFLEGRTKLSDWEQSKYKPSYEWFEQNVGYAQHDADEKHIEKYQRMVEENDRRRRIEADMQKKLSGTNVKLDEDGNVNWTAGREEAKYLKERAEKGQILGSLSIEDRQRAAEENADESVKRRAEAFYALGDEAAAAESKLKAYNEYGKRVDNKYDDNLLGRIAGNYRAGRIGIQANDAGYTAYKLKTDDLEAVEVYQLLGEAIQKNNYNTFKNKNGFEEFVAQNAQYAPQAVDQLKASVPGRVIQLAGAKGLGAAVANAAEAEYMFRQTAGASFITNIQERGLSIEDARALAQNEAVLSGAIEFGMGFAYDKVGDYVSDKVGAGVQKRFFKLLTNKGISEWGAKIIINSAKSAGSFVYDNMGEATEEWLQEGVSVNAGKMSEKGNIPSIAQLTAKSLDASGYSDEDLEQMNEAAKGSWLIGLGRAGMSAAGRIGRSGSENDSAEAVKYYISPEFTASYDSWVTAGRPDRKTLTVGRTSEALRSIGVKEQSITWDTSKINKSLKKHTYLNDGIMKQIPNVLENPIIIMQSTQKDSRVTMFGEVYDGDGLPVMAVLELSPLNRSGSLVLDEIKLASTYSKKKLNDPTSIQRTQSMISNSEILYVDPDKKRTDNWLTLNRLQLPLSVSRYGSLKSIAYSEGNVKQNFTEIIKNTERIFGVKVQLEEKLPNGADGYYRNGVIHLSQNSRQALDFVLTHEIVHHLQAVNKADYNVYKMLALRYTAENGNITAKELIKQKQERYGAVGLKRTEAIDEIAADFAAEMLSGEKLSELFERIDNGELIHDAKRGKSVIMRFVNSVKALIRRIKQRASGKGYLKRAADLEEVISAFEKTAAGAKGEFNTLRENSKNKFLISDENSRLDSEEEELWQNGPEDEEFWTDNPEELKDIIRKLRIRSEYLKGKKLRPYVVLEFARALKQTYGSKVSARELSVDLMKLYNDMAQMQTKGHIDDVEILNRTGKIASEILLGAEVRMDISPEVKAMRDHIRASRISISEKDKLDFGGKKEWNEFRKSNFGRMKITNDGLPVDTFYEELCELYPEYFNKDEYTHPADRMKNIAKVLRDTDGTVIKLDENMDFKSAETFLVYDILEKFSSADADERSVISEIEKIDKTAKTEYEEKRREEMTELRKKFDEKYRQSKERRDRFEKEAQEKISKIRSERRAAEDKKKLLNLLKFFDRIRTTPERLENIKKSMNSEELESFKDAEKFAGKTPEEIVRMLDTQGIRLLEEGYERTDGVKVMGRLELSELENAYMRAKEEDVPRFFTESGGKGDFIPNRLLEQKFKRLHNIQIDTLTYGQVRELIELLAAVKNQIENENKLLAAEEEKRADEITKKIHKELRSGKDFMKRSMGLVSKLSDKGVLKKWKLDQLNANTVFKKLAGYLPDSEFNSLAEELREGQRRKAGFERTVQRHFEGFFGKNLEKGMQKERQKLLDGEWVSIGNGRKITKGMRIALYLHSKNHSNLESIRDFGITIPDKKLYKKHKKDAYNQGETIKLSPSEIREIVSNMSEAEREFADKYAYPFFNDITTKHINEVSRKLMGYDIAVVKDYFPKNTDMNMVESEAVGAYDILSTAENQGFMKHRTGGKALLLVDVFDAVDKTTAGVAKYYGMALAMRDLRKLLGKSDGGGKTTLGLIAELHGEDMKRWIEDLLRDYENPRIDTKLAKERARGLGSSFASSVLTGRVTTLLKQGGALFVGIPEVGIGNWTGSFGRHVYKKDIELWQDASTAFWQRGTDYRKIDPRSWIENTDKFYVQRLCSAVMHGIEKDFKIDRNVRSDEYWEALRQPEVMAEIGRRIDDMINNTQSVYTTMERPTILRKNTAFLKHLLPFKTQNFQDFNLLSQNIQEYRAMIKYAKEGVASKQECTAALQKCADTVLGLTLNYMFVTAMSLAGSVVLGTAERYEEDGDDEEEENKMFEELSPFWKGVNNVFNKDGKGVITPESVSSKMLSDFVNNFAGDFMFCDELAEWVQSAVTGKKYYGMEIGTLEMVNDALEQTGRTLNNLRLIGTDEFSKKQLMTNLKDAVILAGSLFGIPGENTENIINALLFHFSNSVEQANNEWEASIYINPYKIKYDMFKGSTNIKTDEEWYIEQFYDMARFAVNIKKTENRRKAYDDLNTMFWETSEKFKDEEEKERFQEKLYKQLDRLGSRNSNVVKRVLADKESWIERSQVDYSAVDEEIKRLKQRGADIDFKTDKRAVLKYEITDEEGNETEKKVVLTPAESIRYQEDVKQMIYEAFYDAMRDTTWSIRNDTEREIIFNDYKKEAIDQVKRQYIKNKTGDMTAATPFEKFVEEREFRKDAQSFNKIRGNKYVTLDGNTSVYYELAEALASEYDSAYERNLKEIGEALFTEGADISEFIGGNYKKVLYCSEMTDKQREATERAIKSTATKNKLTEAEKAKLLSDFKNNITPYEKNVQWEGSVDSLTVSEKDKLYEKIKKAAKERTEEVLGSRIKNEARVVYNKNSDETWSANVNETDNKNLTEEKNKTESVNVSFNAPASSNKKASYKKRSYKSSNKSRSNKTSNTVVVSNIPKKNNFPVKTENGTKAVRVGTDFYDRNKINTDEIGKKYKRIAKAPTEVLNYDDWRTVMNTWMRCLSEWRFTDDDRKILQMEDSGIDAVFYEPESVAAAFWEWIRYGENAGFDTSEYLNGEE